MQLRGGGIASYNARPESLHPLHHYRGVHARDEADSRANTSARSGTHGFITGVQSRTTEIMTDGLWGRIRRTPPARADFVEAAFSLGYEGLDGSVDVHARNVRLRVLRAVRAAVQRCFSSRA